MKIRALINYKDNKLNKEITKGTIYEVTSKRGKEILNAQYKGQAYAEEVKEEKKNNIRKSK